MSDQHVGVRRRPPRLPLRRVAPVVAGLAAVSWALALGEPARDPDVAQPDVSAPVWTGPPTVDIPGVLPDGAAYAPRLYLDARTSVGVATGSDGSVRVMLAQAPDTFTSLASHPPGDPVQLDGFAADGDTLVWMETTARAGALPVTRLWRADVRAGTAPVSLTANTGEVAFYGFQSDVVVADATVRWTVLVPGPPVRTEVRSVPVRGGQVTTQRIDGQMMLSRPPWVVSAPAGPGSTVTLVNLSTEDRIEVPTAPDESAVCDPAWCRILTTSADGLVGIDLMRPDGSQRRRIAGPEATPTIGDATLLDRFVPLATDRLDGVGLTLYDAARGESQLVAARASDIGGRGGILWWSTGVGSALTWHALDLTRLP